VSFAVIVVGYHRFCVTGTDPGGNQGRSYFLVTMVLINNQRTGSDIATILKFFLKGQKKFHLQDDRFFISSFTKTTLFLKVQDSQFFISSSIRTVRCLMFMK
jgi:hypothetical protein